MKVFLLCVLLLGGCAAARLSLPPLDMQPLHAEFGLRFSHAGMSIPLHGAVQITKHDGRLGIIFPHGRTLGVCRYLEDGMECVPASEETPGARVMLRQIGLAVYRILPSLAQESSRDIVESDFAVRWEKTGSGRSAEYRDLSSQVTVDMHFTEIVRP